MIKSVVTGQAPVTLELRNTPGKNTNKPRWYTHRLCHSWRNSCLHQKYTEVKSGATLRCARSILVHTSHYSRLEKATIQLVTKKRPPPIYYKKIKYTPAVRSKISSKLIFASCVWYSDRAHYELCVLIKDIGRRLPLHILYQVRINSTHHCAYIRATDASQLEKWNKEKKRIYKGKYRKYK